MAGLTATKGPQRGERDDADYAVATMRNVRQRVVGPSLLWELKQGFIQADKPSAVPVDSKSPKIKLLDGRTSSTVEQQPGHPCFRQAGLHETRTQSWKGVIEEDEVTLEQKITVTRLWARQDQGV